MSFELVRAKKKYIVEMFLFRNRSRNLLLYYVCTSMLIDTMLSMNGIVCWYNLLCLENNMTKKISNLMILDNSGIDYAGILLFVLDFLV